MSELRKTSNFLCIKKYYTIVLKSRPRDAPYELIFRAESKNIRFQFFIILLTVKLLCILDNVWKIWNRCLRTIFFSRKTETVSQNIYFVDNLCEDHNLLCSERPSTSVRVKILKFLQDFRWTYFIKISPDRIFLKFSCSPGRKNTDDWGFSVTLSTKFLIKMFLLTSMSS